MKSPVKLEVEESGGGFLGRVDYPENGLEPYAYLESIYVYPGRRNEGNGKHLIQKFEEICIILGAQYVYGTFLPHMDSDPKTVERFYNRNGYEVSDRQPDGKRYISKQLDLLMLPEGEIKNQPFQTELQTPQEEVRYEV